MYRRALDDATRAANALAIAIVKRRPYTLTPTRDPMFDALAESRVDVAATIRSVYPPAGARSAPDAAEVESEFRAACDRRRAERAAMAARAAADAARLAG